MEHIVNRRQFTQATALISLSAVLGAGNRNVFAYSGHNHGGPFDDLGLPELTVSVTDETYTISESEIEANRVLVTLINESSIADPVAAAFAQMGGEFTLEALNEALLDGEAQQRPAWLENAFSPGGSTAHAGTTVQFVIDLLPGSYAVQPDLPGLPFGAVELTVTGDFPSEVPQIEADVTISMIEMAFELSAPFAAGSQLLAVSNDGAAPHFTAIFSVPEGTVEQDFLDLVASFGDPDASMEDLSLQPTELEPFFDATPQSPGTTMYSEVTFDSGTYLLVCFVMDMETGIPHAMQGMIKVVTVD